MAAYRVGTKFEVSPRMGQQRTHGSLVGFLTAGLMALGFPALLRHHAWSRSVPDAGSSIDRPSSGLQIVDNNIVPIAVIQVSGQRETVGDPAPVLAQIHAINQMHMKMGQLVRMHGAAPAVRRHARYLAARQQDANERIAEVALKKGLRLAAIPVRPENAQPGIEYVSVQDDRAAAALKKLKTLRGSAFDHAYVAAIAAGYRTALNLLQSNQTAWDSDVKALFADLQAELRRHLRAARNLKASTTDPALAASLVR